MRIDDLITIDAMTETQEQFFSEYSGSKAMILHGAAGTGKTFIALYKALEEVRDEGRVLQESYYCKIGSPFQRNRSFASDQDDKSEVYKTPYVLMCDELFPTKQVSFQRELE